MNYQAEADHASYIRRFGVIAAQFSIFFLSFIGGLAATRIFYELYFPAASWLGRPYTAFPLAALFAFVVWGLWLKITMRSPNQTEIGHSLTLFPLLLNLIYLTNSTVDLVRSRFIFFVSLWLVVGLVVECRAQKAAWKWWGIGLICTFLLPVYLFTMSALVGRDDVFEFQVVTPKLGIVHPTGYPLYLLLGKLFALLSVQSVAWRLNFASVVYALLAAVFLFLVMWRVGKRPFPAIVGAVVIGLSPTWWSQAIQAEVYALNVLVISVGLWQMAKVLMPDAEIESHKWMVWLAFTLGVGLTNHLTTVILIPAAVLTAILMPNNQFWASRSRGFSRDALVAQTRLKHLLQVSAAFVLPLLLYAYLPLRWQAVVGEPMGFARFVDWVIGGRFQGALQLMAWLRDLTRYEVVGRLFLENWGWFNLAIALLGIGWLLWQQWRVALILVVTWLGYTFYSLNYYVPDLAVFLLPAQIMVGICWTLGLGWLLQLGEWRLSFQGGFSIQPVLLLILVGPVVLLAVRSWPQVDQSDDDGRTQWGTAVLSLPLAENSAILADSDKYPPLFYLQQTEGMRPDLDISVWPDEAAYRAQLSVRLGAGQTVYLARFLPGLEGLYHLRSVGPLTEVSPDALQLLPTTATPTQLSFDTITLVGYELEPVARVDGTQTAVTFYWQTAEPVSVVRHVYVRWSGEPAEAGQHPANNYYPTVAWRPGEIVSDYHLLQAPVLLDSEKRALQVALAPPFSSLDDLVWQTVVEVELAATEGRGLERPFRVQSVDATITGATLPEQIRPKQSLPLLITGFGDAESFDFRLEPVSINQVLGGRLAASQKWGNDGAEFLLAAEVYVGEDNGRYRLMAAHDDGVVCGWMQLQGDGCVLGEIEVSGVPIPAGAVNYEDKIALLSVDVADANLQPGGQINLTINWQSLAPMREDYTVFVQVLDAQDRLVGQV
ncbi:MAG: DUF2723 domain-containing protein, partial [Chloroflexi bacterium]